MNKQYIRKGIESLRYNGIKKTIALTKDHFRGIHHDIIKEIYADVLFINGCFLPHPPRYRVQHQMEQLFVGGIISAEVPYTELKLEYVGKYRVFVFFRCPYTDIVGRFIDEAKRLHKLVIFDVDDLVIDKSYTEEIEYIRLMSEDQRSLYYEGLELIRKTLMLCDIAITTTDRLAEELKHYVPEVYINRNTASERMISLSEEAYVEHNKKDVSDFVTLAYFSGSITHDQDFNIILPAVIKCMEAHKNVQLMIVGELTVPEVLKPYLDRIVYEQFVDWEKLPALIAKADINLAPLKCDIFNEAKSENKWTEAALVRVPTIASDWGAFRSMIKNNETGILCSNTEDWCKAINSLVISPELRISIGSKAYSYVMDNCCTMKSAYGICNFIKGKMNENVVFVVPNLKVSGGIRVALKHAEILYESGIDVTILNEGTENESWIYAGNTELPIINSSKTKIYADIDTAVGTLYTTMEFVSHYFSVKNRVYLVQGMETDFSKPDSFARTRASQSYFYDNIHYVTISKWCQSWLRDRYHKKAEYAPNGIDTKQFYAERRSLKNNKIRILIEGAVNNPLKNVTESIKITEMLDRNKFEIWLMTNEGDIDKSYNIDRVFKGVPFEETPNVYRECDILLKSSLAESFSYPPLEMMATGGYVVVAPNEGNIEYLKDEINCLFYERDVLMTAVNAIERIIDDVELQDRLYSNGIATAAERDWSKISAQIVMLYRHINEEK